MFGKKKLPELYTEEEMQVIDTHIDTHFGICANVFHELVSPDIHVDIGIIEPTAERNYYTLVTIGMGAHKMNIPKELRKQKLDRAELLITLPPDWEIQNDDELWYWPLRWLKILARLPGEQDTWLGYGHTVPCGEPFAENTELCCMMLTMPYFFGADSQSCTLPGGDVVHFYQLLPIYENEMEYKLSQDAEALEDRFPDDFDLVLNVNRPNVISTKSFFLKNSDIKKILEWDEPEGCIASDRIMVDGAKVGYMYREKSEPDLPDSGWCFFAGDEDEAYIDNPDHFGVYALNTVANYDPDIIPLLQSPCDCAFARDEDGVLRLCED